MLSVDADRLLLMLVLKSSLFDFVCMKLLLFVCADGESIEDCVGGGGGEFELNVVEPLGPCIVLQLFPPFLALFT